MTYKMTTRRKLAIASWIAPREGNIYGKLVLDVDKANAYADTLSAQSGEKITLTTMVGKAVGMALSQMPDLNGQIVLGRYKPHKNVAISFLVQIDEGRDLAKVKIDNIHQKSLPDIARELREGARRLRVGKDDEFNKSTNLISLLPTWVLRFVVYIVGYMTSVLGIGIPALGLHARPFGACIITSVGMLGIDEGYAPPTPWARVPFYLAIPAMRRRAVVKDDSDQIEIRTQVDLMATLDHRFIDGFQSAQIAKVLRETFAHPESLNSVHSLAHQ